MDSTTRANRAAWEAASVKHVREYDDLLAQAASGSSLTGTERDLLGPVLRSSPEAVHLQSGHGLDDVALVQAGARSVVGIDYSYAAAGLQVMHVGEHPEPFWRMGGGSAAAWNGRLPNTFSLLAKRSRLAGDLVPGSASRGIARGTEAGALVRPGLRSSDQVISSPLPRPRRPQSAGVTRPGR
jgi:hypothetical protein